MSISAVSFGCTNLNNSKRMKIQPRFKGEKSELEKAKAEKNILINEINKLARNRNDEIASNLANNIDDELARKKYLAERDSLEMQLRYYEAKVKEFSQGST